MDSNATTKSRTGRVLAALVALAGAAALIAVPASAAPGQGTATLVLAKHDEGRTLSGQGVKVIAGPPATKPATTLALPIVDVDPGAKASATANGWLRFKRGKKSVRLGKLRFDLATKTLSGKLGKENIDAFELGATASVDSATGAVSFEDAKLRLTPEAATALREKLGLERALRRDGVGMAWLAAKANPAHAAAQTVSSGVANWGVLASWRTYVLGSFGPGSVGTIATADGATASGALTDPATIFGFPAASGTFEKGLYGASDKLALKAKGNVTFAKPGHCIMEMKFADLELTINGTNSSIALDSSYDIDTPAGRSCTPQPPVATPDVAFASLDLSGVTPTYSADGKAITWTAIPASLTAAGSAAFLGGKYKEGQALDPVTITVGIG
jgi:Htaa